MAGMEAALTEIIEAIKAGTPIDEAWLSKLLRRHNRDAHDATRRVAKRRLLPYYLALKKRDPKRWESWNLSVDEEARLLRVLRMKPRRTASGVATVTVITKPWPCSSNCLYCPSDVRMPKSYLAAEPACQRAERNFFDPYLQVRSRLVALHEMGHVTDKIELIILGGTWNDYPEDYQIWFVSELFRALNEADGGQLSGDGPETRERRYLQTGLTYNEDELIRRFGDIQDQINAGDLTYNQAIAREVVANPWKAVSVWQTATLEDLYQLHKVNEDAAHRVVGLTIETRPDLIRDDSARMMRRLGCTKIQMGIQSLDEEILTLNRRYVSQDQIAHAFEILRLQGFKIQIHFMANLLGSDVERDKRDYQMLVTDERFLPDEVKLYPCCLVESSDLMRCYEDGVWRPYTEEELVDLLVADLMITPAYTRISRMIRDISSTDIVCGNKKTNLRQMVEGALGDRSISVQEIRMREVATSDVEGNELTLTEVPYETSVSQEHFLQWVTPDGHIAGFLRLSLPHEGTEAMIREVHVYGRVAGLGGSEAGGAQHTGLGKTLVERACQMARDAGFTAINVISSVGTRNYYRRLGFGDAELYQKRTLVDQP